MPICNTLSIGIGLLTGCQIEDRCMSSGDGFPFRWKMKREKSQLLQREWASWSRRNELKFCMLVFSELFAVLCDMRRIGSLMSSSLLSLEGSPSIMCISLESKSFNYYYLDFHLCLFLQRVIVKIPFISNLFTNSIDSMMIKREGVVLQKIFNTL